MYKYAIEIFYSEEDGGYIATVPELAGCSAFGETEEDALKEVMTAIDLWLETARNMGSMTESRCLIVAESEWVGNGVIQAGCREVSGEKRF